MNTIYRTFLKILFSFSIYIPIVSAGVTLNLLTWEGYAPEAQVLHFEQLMTERYSLPVTLNASYISTESDLNIMTLLKERAA